MFSEALSSSRRSIFFLNYAVYLNQTRRRRLPNMACFHAVPSEWHSFPVSTHLNSNL